MFSFFSFMPTISELYEDDSSADSGGGATDKKQSEGVKILVRGNEETIDLSDRENVKALLQKGRVMEEDKKALNEAKRGLEEQQRSLELERTQAQEALKNALALTQTKGETKVFVDEFGQPDKVAKLEHTLDELEGKIRTFEDEQRLNDAADILNDAVDKACEGLKYADTKWGKETLLARFQRIPNPQLTDLLPLAKEVEKEYATFFSKPENLPEGVADKMKTEYADNKLKDKNATAGTNLGESTKHVPGAVEQKRTPEELRAAWDDGTIAKEAQAFTDAMENE